MKRVWLVILGVISMFLFSGCGKIYQSADLMNAALENDLEKVEQLLKEGADPNGRTSMFRSMENNPIISACLNDKYDAVKLMIEYGADVNLSPKDSYTPLTAACTRVSYEVVKLLVENGADVNKKDSVGRVPISQSLVTYNKDKANEVFYYLIEQGANLNESQQSMIADAAYFQHLEILDYLLSQGISINVKDSQNRTALIDLAKRSSFEGKSNEYAISAIKYLLDKGADKTIKDSKGKNALDYAKELGCTQAIELLQD